MSRCELARCEGPGSSLYDPGVTGLALLAFLGAGETHKHGKYKRTVRQGLKYLKEIQDPEGCFGPRTEGHFTYNHAIGALTMAEAYAMTGSPLFKESAQRPSSCPRRVKSCTSPMRGSSANLRREITPCMRGPSERRHRWLPTAS